MTRYHIAAKQLESDIAAYAKRFDFLELRLPRTNEPSPSIQTLRRWRKQVPPPFDFSVVVGPTAAGLRQSAELEKEIAAALEAADALQARCVVISTPVEVTPTRLWAERLAKVCLRMKRDATHVIWERCGLWEWDASVILARDLGVVLAVDPMREQLPDGPMAYARLRALGETRSFGTHALSSVANAVGERRDAYVIIETGSALKECKLLRQIATRKPQAAGGKVLLPRGGVLRVSDDEQE